MIGTLYPREAPREDPARSEVCVWQALARALPEGWTAGHSLRVRGNDNVVREADFVVASPEFGLLVLEVKGGRVQIDGGSWTQDGRALAKSPIAQGLDSAHTLDTALGHLGVVRPPFGAAVVLPDVEFSQGPLAGDSDGVVLGSQDLAFLDEAIRSAAARAIPRKHVPSMEMWAPAVHRLWGEQWVPALSTRDTAGFASRRMLRLDDEQLRLLDLALDTPRAVVTGAAGTGKTLLARELCLRRRAQGQRTLYLCFTKALAAALRRDFPSDGVLIRAANIRQLAVEYLNQAGRPFDFDRPGAWGEIGLEGAQAAEALGVEPYDLVVIDEALDLSDADWLLVEILARGGHAWALTDPRQHFWRERSLPPGLFEGAARFRLPVQHRNPHAVERFAALYANDRAAAGCAETGAPAGSVSVVVAPDVELRECVARQVRRWRQQGAKASDIAVVTLAGIEKTRIVGGPDLCGERIAPAESDDASSRVVTDTFLRFKGFERPFVVVTELGFADAGREYETRMHIALTRGTAEVVVVCTAAEARNDARLMIQAR